MIGELGIESDELDLLVERRASRTEDLVEEVRQRHQRRPDVERVAVSHVCGELAADDVVAFEHRHVMAERSQPNRRRQAADAAPDDHNLLGGHHLAPLRLQQGSDPCCNPGSGTEFPGECCGGDREHAESTDDRDDGITEVTGETDRLHHAHVGVFANEGTVGVA